MAKKTFIVQSVSCNHCKQAIEGVLSALDGVHASNVEIDSKRVSVEFDEVVVSTSRIVDEIENQGFAVQQE